jgi:hypothetical protein
MKRPALVISLLITVVIISVAFSSPPEVKFKNLKVLPKNTTKAQMDTIMNHFARSLGVRCNFCHVRGKDAQNTFDFPNDSLENKKIARGMFKMTAKLNKKYFKGGDQEKGLPLLTCYSCHRGQEHPATIPPPPPPRRPQQPATTTPGTTTTQ